MSLLPSRGPDASTSQDGELQIVGVDEDVSSVLDALSSETARDILNAVYEDPGTPSELADRLGMSIQKVSYHLEKLEEQELIAIAGTQYSEKGQEMTVYEPPDDPLVVFVGTPDRKRTLRSLLERLVPAVGLLTAASVMVQAVFGTLPGLVGSSGSGDAPAGGANETDAGTNDTSGDAGDGGSEFQSRDINGSDDDAETMADAPQEGEDGDGYDLTETTEDPSTSAGNGTEEPATPTETPTEDPSTPTGEATETPVDMATEVTETATNVATGGGVDLEPGVAFFLGGLLVVGVVGLTWAYTN